MTASYDKLVIDNEILGMVMRAVEGIEVNDTTLAFDEIKKQGLAAILFPPALRAAICATSSTSRS